MFDAGIIYRAGSKKTRVALMYAYKWTLL